jgi:hypothetical protein
MRKLVFLIAMVLMISCEKEVLELDALGENVGIVGTWIEKAYEGDTAHFERARKLDDQKYGFTLGEDGSFVERKNSGWCGTPPISYANYDGTWEAVSDSLLSITVGYWGGMMTYQMRIVSLKGEELAIKYLYSEDMAKTR